MAGSPETRSPGEVGQPAELRTILITDIRGYTHFTGEQGDEVAAKLASRLATVTRQVVEAREGSLLELRGDEAVAIFASPRQAVRASVDLQDRFLQETEADPSLPLTAGVGIDIGEVVPVEGGYRGSAINLAARLCAIAKAGEVLVSSEVVHVAGMIESITYRERGQQRIKGFSRPITVIQVVPSARDYVARLAPYTPKPPRPDRRVARWFADKRVIAAAVALVLTAVGIPIVLTRGGGASFVAANSVGVIDPASGHLIHQIPVGQNPQHLAATPDAFWATNEVDNTVSRIDPTTAVETDRIPVGTAPAGIAIGSGAVWVTNGFDGTVTRIDPKNDQTTSLRVGNGPDGIASGFGSIWVADLLDSAVVRVDPSTDRIQRTIPMEAGPTAISASDDAIWVTLFQANSVARIDPASNTASLIPVGNGPDAVAAGGAGIWVANSLDNTVSRIDPATDSVASTLQVGAGPNGIAVGDSSLWVSEEYDEAIVRLVPSKNSPPQQISLGNRPEGLLLGPAGLLVAVREGGQGHQGGVVRADEPFPVTLDPATWALWVQPYAFDGLIAFKRADGIESELLVPDLAVALPHPADGGKTYTFTLRRDIRYADGTLLKPDDVRYSAERLFKLSRDFFSIAGTYLTSLVGADACVKDPQTCSLSEGITSNEQSYEVTFHLTHPDPAFLYQLILVYLVPSGTPERDLEGPRFAVGTGPYVISSYQPATATQPAHLQLLRNRYFQEWSKAARPDGYPDEIDGTFKVPADQYDTAVDTAAVRAVEHGQADFAPAGSAGIGIPYDPRIFEEVATRYSSLVHRYPLPGTVSLILNPSTPPFNDQRARQALSFALDRNRIARWAGGRATCQFIPVGQAGYSPYCPYTVPSPATGSYPYAGPDVTRAQQLVGQSGTRGDRVVVAWTTNGFPIPKVGSYVVQVLNSLGYDARLKWVDAGKYCFCTSNVESALGWSADYSLASGSVPIVGCPGLGPACDASLSKMMQTATKMEGIDLAAANRRWAEIDKKIVDHARLIPLFQPVEWLIVSSRVHNFQNGNGAVLKDQFWVQ